MERFFNVEKKNKCAIPDIFVDQPTQDNRFITSVSVAD